MREPIEPALGLAAAHYFQPPQGYFWRWAEGNEVVEWVNGTTITYREELAALLTGLAPDGLPPLGAVLLVLAACNTAWQHNSGEIGLLQGLLRGLPLGGPPDEELTFHLSVARSFLDIISTLPAELRQGVAKEHLLREVLGAGTPAKRIPADQARQLAADLNASAETEPIQPEGQLTRWQFRADLLSLDRASRQFSTVHSLELRLRTGLDQLPAPLPELPPPPPPEPAAADLLAELAQQEATAGLARLVPALRAALHLPQAARQAGEQPLGGVADLSNRGPLDRLLLSELAQDDLSLLARLAHGEALYLRREAPPLPQPPPRVLLLDTTLPMWGLPRVAGLAAALALDLTAGAAPGGPGALAFALGGEAAQPLDLHSRAGVVAALGLLAAARHCGAALPVLLPTLPAGAEAVLITEAQAAQHLDFRLFLGAAPAALRFLLTVARSGELALYELAGGQRTLLSTSQVELKKLLLAPAHTPRPGPEEVVPPAFFRKTNAPLFFPTLNVALTPTTMLHDERLGAIGLDKSRRLLYWANRYVGARELVLLVETGHCCFGFNKDNQYPDQAFLLVGDQAVPQRPVLVLYKVNLADMVVERVDLSPQLSPDNNTWTSTTYKDGYFVLQTPAGHPVISILCPLPNVQVVAGRLSAPPSRLAPPMLGLPSARFLNPGYSVLQRVSRVGINQAGLLTLESRCLQAGSGNELLLETGTAGTSIFSARPEGEGLCFTPNPHLRSQRLVWPNGSEAFTDGRGLLHLRSADPALAEISLVLAIGRPTAAWASDGKACGNTYFTGLTAASANWLSAADFYAQYIQPFIDQLR